VAKDQQLDIAVQMIGGASDKLDKAAQQQVHEREDTDGTSQAKEARSYDLAG
jgi:hypothetical protein